MTREEYAKRLERLADFVFEDEEMMGIVGELNTGFPGDAELLLVTETPEYLELMGRYEAAIAEAELERNRAARYKQSYIDAFFGAVPENPEFTQEELAAGAEADLAEIAEDEPADERADYDSLFEEAE